MAFAAACAGKALAISRKHRALDEVALAAQTQLQEILTKSLQRADVDSARFEDFLRHRNQQTARALLDAVGLDRGLVLLRRGTRWEVAARVVDREEGGADALARHAVRLRPLFRAGELLNDAKTPAKPHG